MKHKSLNFRVMLALVLVLLLAMVATAGAQEPEPNDPAPEALPVDPEPPIPVVSSVASTVVPGVVPDSVVDVLGVGTSLVVKKTVTLPEVPPKLDLVLMVDLSGSYWDDLPNIKSKAPNIFTGVRNGVADSQFGLTTFVDYPFPIWGYSSSGDYAYKLDQDLTAVQATWQNAIDAMSTKYGGDGPESQYVALYQAATGNGQTFLSPYAHGNIPAGADPSWRDGVTHVIAITTDASFHIAGDGGGPFPYPGPIRDATVAALNAKNIKVIAIKAPGSTAQMDDIAGATGGAVTSTGNTSAEIVEAILNALEELTFTVTPESVGCDPLQLTFNPATHLDVEGGESVVFEETITVPPDATPGIYNCQVDFYADETVIGTESISIVVYDPSAGFVTGGGWIESPAGAYLPAPLPFYEGSYYDLVSASGITWGVANTAANALTLAGCEDAHLVTITSQAEQDALFGFFDGALEGKWYGGFQNAGEDDPEAGWNWVTGEAWDYTNWAEDEPNDTGGDEHYLLGWDNGWFWNDEANLGNVTGYVVEYDGCLSGKATFGFISKYKRGASVPTGNTEFQFHAAGLNFHSSSYEWLVVTGSSYAKFKGVGTINGDGPYKFMLWAGDADPDTFRIKIWTEDDVGNETVEYDNGFDQELGSGSIIIHTKK